MSAIGGSMVPRYVMSDTLKWLGKFTFNGWALDGFQKVFWYDLPITAIRTELFVLMTIAIVLARRPAAWLSVGGEFEVRPRTICTALSCFSLDVVRLPNR